MAKKDKNRLAALIDGKIENHLLESRAPEIKPEEVTSPVVSEQKTVEEKKEDAVIPVINVISDKNQGDAEASSEKSDVELPITTEVKPEEKKDKGNSKKEADLNVIPDYSNLFIQRKIDIKKTSFLSPTAHAILTKASLCRKVDMGSIIENMVMMTFKDLYKKEYEKDKRKAMED